MENKSTFKSKIENLSRSQKTASIIGLVILLATVGVGIFFFIMGTKNQQNKDNQPNIEQDSSNDQNQTNNEQNGETEDNNSENGGIIIEDGTEEDSNNGENPDDGNQEDEENSVDEEIKDIMDETTEGQEIVELTQTEIDYINNEIFENTEVAYFPNKFLQCYYKTLEEIDLGELFYNGIGFDNQEDVTEEEKQAIIALGVSLDFGGIVKLPEEKVDEVLKKYTGEGIDFFKDELAEEFYYLEEYKAYYTITGDVSFAYHKMESGYRTADGKLVLFYRFNQSEDNWICKVTVKENEDRSFQFISNEMYGLTFISYEDRNEVLSDWETYEYIAKVEAVDLNSGKIMLKTYQTIDANRGPQYGGLSPDEVVELELAENVEIILEAGMFEAYYLDPEVMERLQDSPCFCDKEFFVIIKDGKVVKMIDRIGLRIWL